MNDENNDLASYFDQPTFKAFQAVSPRPALDAPVALDQALQHNATEVWEMLQQPETRVFIAGTGNMLPMLDQAMVAMAGSARDWASLHAKLRSSGRWSEVLY